SKPDSMEKAEWEILDRQALGVVRLTLARNVAFNVISANVPRTFRKDKRSSSLMRYVNPRKHQEHCGYEDGSTAIAVESEGDLLAVSVEDPMESWVLDSGVSFHATLCRNSLQKFVGGRGGTTYLVNGKAMPIMGRGDVKIRTSTGAYRRHVHPEIEKETDIWGWRDEKEFVSRDLSWDSKTMHIGPYTKHRVRVPKRHGRVFRSRGSACPEERWVQPDMYGCRWEQTWMILDRGPVVESGGIPTALDESLVLKNKSLQIRPYLNGRCIYLVGMMGSGKTTIGKLLAEVLDYSFFDSDSLVETLEGMSVAEIFNQHGEGFFREKETKVLEEVSTKHHLVISTGGGAVIRPINWRHMQSGVSVWLDVPIDCLARRISAVGTGTRPLLHSEGGDGYTTRPLLHGEGGDAYTKAFTRLSELFEKRHEAYTNANARVSFEHIAGKLGKVDVDTLSPSVIAIEKGSWKLERMSMAFAFHGTTFRIFDITINRFNITSTTSTTNPLTKKRLTFIRCSSSSSPAALPAVDFSTLQSALDKKDSDAVKEALDQLSEVGWAKRWSSQPYVSRRSTSLGELTTLGIKNAENLAIPSVRNDAAFLTTVVGVAGALAVLAGQLPGDWGFFVPYLIGAIPLVVLAIGSVSPGGKLDAKELDRLAVVTMAGLAAEGLTYEKVIGQSADLFTLQRFINRSNPQPSKAQQQNLTRWAVLLAASLLKNNKGVHEALMDAMSNNASPLECIKAIEMAS
ncbi:hypothetical protein KSS87_006586, partial [Heliosperma pusillum]